MPAVGTDIVRISRLSNLSSPAFLARSFTAAELEICAGRSESLAGRWAAKEAVMKALGVPDSLGLGFTPPEPQDGLRCQYDAGNYQVAVEAFVWRTYEDTLPPDAVQTDIAGHRAASWWVMKPTDWNNRWWFSCMIAFKTSYGLIQQSLFFSPIHSPDAPECMTENMRRANELVGYYKF